MTEIIKSAAALVSLYIFVLFPVLVIHCFYDDRITVSKKKAALLLSVPIGVGLFNIFPVIEITITLLLVAAVPIIAVTGGKMTFFHRFVNWSRYLLLCILAILCLAMVNSSLALIAGYEDPMNTDEFDMLVPLEFILFGIPSILMYLVFVRKNNTIMFRKQDKLAVWGYGILLLMLTTLYSGSEPGGTGYDMPLPENAQDYLFLFFVIFLTVFLPLFIVKNCQSSHYSRLSEHQQYFLEAELNASRQYKAAQEETRAFRHDVQNNLTAVSMLMEQGKFEEAKQYIDDMRTEVNSFSPKIITGDEMLDSLISAKLAKLKDNGIKLTINGVIDGGLSWKPMDICTVFANAFDNAIEAASQVPEGEPRYIEMNIKKTAHQHLISIANSCKEDTDCEALMSENIHFTSKADKSLHGFGVKNIKKIIEKNAGMMKINCKSKRFTMDMLINRT